MRDMRFFLSGVLIFVGSFLLGQENLSGIVVVDFEDRDASGILVLNKSNKMYTTTDIAGHFSITAEEGDVLSFSGAFLEDRDFVVTKKALRSKSLAIHVNVENIKLDELLVKPKLTGNYKKDIATVPKNDDVEKLYASLGIDIRTRDIEPEEKVEKVLPGLFSLNVGALYKLLSGDKRRLENLRAYDSKMLKITYVKDYLGDEFFTDYLHLPKGEIYQFLVYVQGKYTFLYDSYYFNKDFMQMQLLLESKAKEYRKRLKERAIKLKEKINNTTD